jgi:hypothetical protein
VVGTVRLSRFCLLCALLLLLVPRGAKSQGSDLYTARAIGEINEERYGPALEYLEKALAISPDNPEAVYYAGVAASRLGRYGEAEAYFLKASRLDETAGEVRYELGRVFFLTSRCEEAAGELSRFLSQGEEGTLAEQARGMMADCGEVVEESKPLTFHIFAGGQYDSNVILEQENPPVRAEDKNDFRGVFYLTAEARPWRNDTLELKGDYAFYQSLHLELTEFNVQHHRLTPLEVELTASEILRPSVGYAFEYTFFGGDKYGQVHRPFVKLVLGADGSHATELLYEYRDQTYWNSDLYPTNALRSGYRNSLGLKQRFGRGKLSGFVFASGDFDRAEADFWSYDGFTAGADLYYRVTNPLYLFVKGEYGERHFKEDYPIFGEKREDNVQVYSLGANYQISGRIGLYISQSFTLNGSNLDIYEYDRSVTSLFLTVGLP